MDLEKLEICVPVINKKYGLCLECKKYACFNVDGETT
jgi:hypothetical protein